MSNFKILMTNLPLFARLFWIRVRYGTLVWPKIDENSLVTVYFDQKSEDGPQRVEISGSRYEILVKVAHRMLKTGIPASPSPRHGLQNGSQSP